MSATGTETRVLSPHGRQGPVSPARAQREIRYDRGQTLFFEGDDASDFLEIVSGTVRCSRLTHDGRRQIFRFADAGEMLGVGCVDCYGYSAEAVTGVVVRRRPLAELDPAIAADAGLRQRVLQALRDELAATRAHMLLLGRMSASEKLAAFLRARAARTRDGVVQLPMGRGDIADYLGLTIETVSRKLKELRVLGAIRLEAPNRIRVIDLGRIDPVAEAA